MYDNEVFLPKKAKKNEPAPQDWETEVNQWGGVRRFRRTAHGIEYEKEIIIDGIPVPESQLEEFNRRRREAAEENLRKQNEARVNPPQPTTQCPFLCGRGVYNTECRRECVFYGQNGCEFRCTNRSQGQDTIGKKCPFKGKCEANCTMYAHGCTLLEFIKIIK